MEITWIAPSSAVARLVCLSMVRLRSVSSGSELTAAIRPRVFCCAPDKHLVRKDVDRGCSAEKKVG